MVIVHRRGSRPFVSCVMATWNRPRFAEIAAGQFLAQDWPAGRRELLVLDDSDPGREPRIPEVPGLVRVLHMAGRVTLGDKRIQALALARGDVILHWDDDDWSGPGRIERLVRPLWLEGAEASMFRYRHLVTLPNGRFWILGGPWRGQPNDGTLTTWKRIFEGDRALVRYTPGLFESIAARVSLTTNPVRWALVEPGGDYVYVRSAASVWQDPAWARQPAERPGWFPAGDVDRLRAAWEEVASWRAA
jgi:glycosyltransferase involved in cell wall biosynthesis